jgi:pyruvate/2-oxoglutarate/acetoin dehydrogenase E1 component
LALTGRRAFVEIMFGDFITLAFDQIVNNASKFFHMYHRKLSCPVIVRAPMGGVAAMVRLIPNRSSAFSWASTIAV